MRALSGNSGSKHVCYPLMVHRVLRAFLSYSGRLPGAWRLRHRVLDVAQVAFPEGPIRTRLRFGQRFWVRPNDLIGRYIFYTGLWEAPVALHFFEHLRLGDCVLDVGANVGQYTVLAAKRVGPQGRVFAVEPSMAAAKDLCRNIRENRLRNVHVLELAAWDRETTLYLSAGDRHNSGTAEVSAVATESRSSRVPGRRLDEVLAAIGCMGIDVIKIDIEGAELTALRGLSRLFANRAPRAIYCEILEGAPERFGYTPRDLLLFFSHYGYRPWLFSERGLVPFDPQMIVKGFAAMLLFAIEGTEVNKAGSPNVPNRNSSS